MASLSHLTILNLNIFFNSINEWTSNQKGKINEKKTVATVFNFTRNYQFSTRLKLNNHNLEIVDEKLLLGTIITITLSFDRNTEVIVKKAYARLELLRKVASFSPPTEDLKIIYISYIRSLLEQSCTVWNSLLTEEVRGSSGSLRWKKVASYLC